MGDDRRTQHELTAGLLREVLPNRRWDDLDFLEWVYDHNPVGETIEQNLDEDGVRKLHIGGVPIVLRTADEERTFSLLLNSSAARSEQGKGSYVKGLYKIFKRSVAEGRGGIFGVTNAESTGPAVKGFGASYGGSLPARLHVPLSVPSSVRHHEVNAAYLMSEEFQRLADDLDCRPKADWTRVWTPEVLRWRLSWPGVRYWVHVRPEVMAVTTKTMARGVPVGVLLKTVRRQGAPDQVDVNRMLAAVCVHLRVPALVYAGYNRRVPVSGFRLRQDRLPSPLNIAFQLSEDIDPESFVFETFEFLDFDAY